MVSDNARQPLPSRVVPTLDMDRLPAVFATSRMLIFWNHLLIRFPKVRITMCGSIGCRDVLPKLLASRFTAVANEVSHDGRVSQLMMAARNRLYVVSLERAISKSKTLSNKGYLTSFCRRADESRQLTI